MKNLIVFTLAFNAAASVFAYSCDPKFTVEQCRKSIALARSFPYNAAKIDSTYFGTALVTSTIGDTTRTFEKPFILRVFEWTPEFQKFMNEAQELGAPAPESGKVV